MLEKKYINTSFSSEFEKVNEEFLKCTIAVMSSDQVANGTKFTKESIDKALPTINYAPVLGYFNGDDFEGHGQEIVLSDNGIDVRVKTVPFGVVIKDSYRYIDMPKDNGSTEQYLAVDCYLWSRYSEAIDRVKDNECNQSMEITVNDGSWQDCYFEVTDFNFSGLCILGEDVPPAFTLAKIRTSDNFSKDDVKGEYAEMMFALDKFLELEEGGEPMDDDKELEFKKKRKCSKCEEEIEVEGEFDESEEFICDKCAEETEPQKCPTCGKELDEEGECPECDDTEEDYQAKYNEVVAELNEVKAKFVDMESQYSELNTEVEELRSFKEEVEKAKFEAEEQARKDGIDSQLEIYAELSQCEGYLAIMDKKYEVEVETTELMLKALAYDNDIKIGKKTKKNFSKETVKIPVSNFQSEELTEAEKRYGKGIHKYIKK